MTQLASIKDLINGYAREGNQAALLQMRKLAVVWHDTPLTAYEADPVVSKQLEEMTKDTIAYIDEVLEGLHDTGRKT